MKAQSYGYGLREALRSLRRNGLMTLATVGTVAISLFILGGFMLLVMNINQVTSMIESQLEVVAFMDVDAAPATVAQVEGLVKDIPGVSATVLVSKEQGLAQLNQQFGPGHDLVAALEGYNPLPDYLRIQLESAGAATAVASIVADIPGVEKVNYGQGIIERLVAVVSWIRVLGMLFIGLLAGAAVFLVATTTRLTVNTRQQEVAVMKYVGASDWFIRWPFFLEGLSHGLLGASLAAGLLYMVYQTLIANISTSLSFIPLITDTGRIIPVLTGLVAAGLIFGAIGSVFTLHRYLRV